MIPGDEGKSSGGINEGPGSGHEEEAGRVELVPLGVGEDADDDSGGKES